MMRGAALGNISRPPARAPLLVDLFLIRAVSVSAAQFFSPQSSVLQTEATLKLTLRHHCPLVMELVVLMAHLGARCGIRLSIIVRKALLAACQMVQLVANV